MIRLGLMLCAGVLLGGCSGDDGEVFIAQPIDFAPFRSWARYSLGDVPLQGHPPGPRFGYLKQAAPKGASEYPVGSIIVKTVETTTDPTQWDIFAMVKRGGGYNPDGALNWEFFLLRIDPSGNPLLLARGANPADPSPDAGTVPGGSYQDTGGTGVTCNRCHGAPGTQQNDHILSAALAPGAQ